MRKLVEGLKARARAEIDSEARALSKCVEILANLEGATESLTRYVAELQAPPADSNGA